MTMYNAIMEPQSGEEVAVVGDLVVWQQPGKKEKGKIVAYIGDSYKLDTGFIADPNIGFIATVVRNDQIIWEEK